MNIAVVPTSSDRDGDKLFDIDNPILNEDNRLMTYYLIREKMGQLGHNFKTYDMYESLDEVDYFIFYRKATKLWLELLKRGYGEKIIYYACEPETVVPEHSLKGLKKLSKDYKAILTWNDEAVDNERIYKLHSVYYIQHRQENKEFNARKLLVSISSNKKSHNPKGLYAVRQNVIDYFERKEDSGFEFYGRGWDSQQYRNYRGECKDKFEIYNQFKFALCLENMKDVQGYVSEKIFDCFMAGVVPVYMGASNIEKYVPENCFVRFDQFESIDALYSYLKNVSEYEWEQYIYNINKFVSSEDMKKFSAEEYCKTLLSLFESMKEYAFNMTKSHRIKILICEGIKKIYGKIKSI